MKVIQESYRAGESWPFFVTLERGEEIRGYFRVDYDALLNLADTLNSTRETDCKGCRLEGAGCAECSSGIAHEAARRIRKALGWSDGFAAIKLRG